MMKEEETTHRNTDQSNPEETTLKRVMGVDKGAEEGDRTVRVRVSFNPLTILDLIIYCAEHKYPLSARIAIDIEDGDDFDVKIDGCHGHGHDEPETLILRTINLPPQVFSDGSPTTLVACCGNCAERLALKGCSKYSETNNDGCCVDHKFL